MYINGVEFEEKDIEVDIIRNSESKRLDIDRVHVPENYKLHKKV